MQKSIDFGVQPTDLHHSIYRYFSGINYCLNIQSLDSLVKAFFYHMMYYNWYHVIFVGCVHDFHVEILPASLLNLKLLNFFKKKGFQGLFYMEIGYLTALL